jgi:hypothetical protein
MTGRAFRRAWDIYLTHIGLFAFMLGAAVILLPRHPASAHFTVSRDWVNAPNPLATLLLAAALLVQPVDFDILPFYALIILLVPLRVRLWEGGRAAWLLSISAALWLLSQPGVLPSPHLPAWVVPGNFNFFAWQFLFVCGVILGCLQRTLLARASFSTRLTWAVVLPLYTLLYVLRRAHFIPGLPFIDLRAAQSWWVAKATLGPLRLCGFLLFAYLIAQVFTKFGPHLEKTLLHRVLCFLGQHSLQVFAGSILISYAIPYSYHVLGIAGSRVAQVALDLAGIASLAIPAWLHGIYRERLKRRSQPPSLAGSQASEA